jgi:hypothetical protein
MATEEFAHAPRVQERPWWTSGSKYALAFIVASNAALLLTVFVPEFSHWRDRSLQRAISDSEQRQERDIAKANESLTSLNRQVEVTRLLFEHFFGKPAREQRAVVSYLTYQFPQDLRKKSLQAILVLEARPAVRQQITKSVAAVQARPVTKSKVDLAVEGERRGFQSLLVGDLAKARQAFAAAFAVYPTYHNVDEITHKVLTPHLLSRYAPAGPAQRRQLQKDTLGIVLTSYSWGIPPGLRATMQARYDHLR